jgi:acetyl-CoA carboxylase biotin carboxyl carrier protein
VSPYAFRLPPSAFIEEVCKVATEKAGSPRPFDVKTIEHLIGLMAQHELAEIALQEGEQKIRLRKAVAPSPVVYAAPPVAHAPAPSLAARTSDTAAAAAPAPVGKKLLEIKSEMVGTFYAKPKPDKDDYVKVGGRVSPDTVVCQIEAMKIFNEVTAGVAGTVAETCVKNGDFVEFGTVLFRVDPS